MSERCVDASVAVMCVVKGEPFRRRARQWLRDALTEGIHLIAPPLFQYETESAIQTKLCHGAVDVAGADLALEALAAMEIQLVSHSSMAKRAREIARQFDQPKIYDSLYAALAEFRGCEFWTADKRFCDAVAHDLDFVRYLPDYEPAAVRSDADA